MSHPDLTPALQCALSSVLPAYMYVWVGTFDQVTKDAWLEKPIQSIQVSCAGKPGCLYTCVSCHEIPDWKDLSSEVLTGYLIVKNVKQLQKHISSVKTHIVC